MINNKHIEFSKISEFLIQIKMEDVTVVATVIISKKNESIIQLVLKPLLN